MDTQSYEASHFKDYHRPKDSYLSNIFENNQLLVLLVNVIMLIICIMAPYVLFSASEYLSYLVNQIPLFHPLYLD